MATHHRHYLVAPSQTAYRILRLGFTVPPVHFGFDKSGWWMARLA